MKKRGIIIILVFIAIFGFNLISSEDFLDNYGDKFGFLKKKDPIENFWNWFIENGQKLKEWETDRDKYLNQILGEGRKIGEGLAFELEPIKNDRINFTISADGVYELFPVVEKIISKAPQIDGWNFIAFRQRMTKEEVEGIVLKMEKIELDPNQMKFYPIKEGENLDIIIYTKDVTENNYNQIVYGGLLLVDNLLGEYDCVTKVRNYDFHNLPTNEEDLKELRPLIDLADYVDDFYTKK